MTWLDDSPDSCWVLSPRAATIVAAVASTVWDLLLLVLKGVSWRSEYSHLDAYPVEMVLLCCLLVLHLVLLLGAMLLVEVAVLLAVTLLPFFFYAAFVTGTMVCVDQQGFPSPGLHALSGLLLATHILSVPAFAVVYAVALKLWWRMHPTFPLWRRHYTSSMSSDL